MENCTYWLASLVWIVAQFVLLICKLTGAINWEWAVVCIPLWCFCGLWVMVLLGTMGCYFIEGMDESWN